MNNEFEFQVYEDSKADCLKVFKTKLMDLVHTDGMKLIGKYMSEENGTSIRKGLTDAVKKSQKKRTVIQILFRIENGFFDNNSLYNITDKIRETKYTVESVTHVYENNIHANLFWRIFERLYKQGILEEGWDFKVQVPTIVESNILEGKAPVKTLYIRLGNVYRLYSEQIIKETGNVAVQAQVLQMYLEQHPAYIGVNRASRFYSNKTNKATVGYSYLFDLEKIGIDIPLTSDFKIKPLEPTHIESILHILICNGCKKRLWFNLLQKTTIHHFILGIPFTINYVRENDFSPVEFKKALTEFLLGVKYKFLALLSWYLVYADVVYWFYQHFINR